MSDAANAFRGRVPAAVLWDMDGTLVDTEPYWIASEFDLADKYGGRWTREDALTLVGYDLIVAGRYIREHMGIDLTPEDIVDEAGTASCTRRPARRAPWREGSRSTD